MPTGIIMQSSSVGATQEAIEKVLTENGYEPDKPAPTTEEVVEPKREDFDSDEAFETAHQEFTEKQEEAEAAPAEKKTDPPRPTRRQRAVDKATKQLQEENRTLNARIAALEGKGGNNETPAAQPELKAPERKDFKNDQEFDDAMFDYRYKVRRAKEQAEAARTALDTRLKENFENYQSQVAAFKEEHDDWDEVVNQKIPVHESVFLAVQELENGAAVTYYLGQHPEEAKRLAELSPLSAVIALGKIAAKLKGGAPETTDSGKKKTPPKAIPEPVRPVSTAATSSSLTSREAAQQRNYKDFKRAQRAGR